MIFSTLAPHLIELSMFQAGCFKFAQVKASIELGINKLSDAVANCEKFNNELIIPIHKKADSSE